MTSERGSSLVLEIKTKIDCQNLFQEEFPNHWRDSGNYLCPWHQDQEPSLQPTQDYLYCHAEGKWYDCFDIIKCSRKVTFPDARRILAGRAGIDMSGVKQRGGRSSGNGRNTATPPGLTLAELAKAKNLQIDGQTGLTAWGVSQVKQRGATVLRIPYSTLEGDIVAVRFRLSLSGGQRFRWRKGDKVLLYGLWRMAGFREQGWILLVEGETDCWTAWAHDLPALGIPGKGTWRSEWAEHLNGFSVYLWVEPDAQELPRKILESIPDLMVINAPDRIKDLSEAHLQGREIPGFAEKLKQQAIPAKKLRDEEAAAHLRELEEQAQSVLQSPDSLELVRSEIEALGYGGDLNQPLIVYLAVTSRLLSMRPGAMPVHLLLLSQPGAGKSYTISTVLLLLPPEAFKVIDADSPRALIYDDSDLQHRVLVFGEADSRPAGEDNAAASAVRNLLQDHHLHYDVTVKEPDGGGYTVQKIRKEGPTVLVTTSTRRLGAQLDSRLFTLDIDDGLDKLRAALQTQASLELSGPHEPDAGLIAYQALLQNLAPWDVVVPYSKGFAGLLGKRATGARILRDFARLVSLIKAVTIMRHRHRCRDESGRLVAEIQDYAFVHALVGPMYEATVTGATDEVRAVVTSAISLYSERGKEPVTVTDVAKYLHIHKSTASRRVRTALRGGWLIGDNYT